VGTAGKVLIGAAIAGGVVYGGYKLYGAIKGPTGPDPSKKQTPSDKGGPSTSTLIDDIAKAVTGATTALGSLGKKDGTNRAPSSSVGSTTTPASDGNTSPSDESGGGSDDLGSLGNEDGNFDYARDID